MRGAAFTPEPTVILMSTTKTVWTYIPFPEPPDLEENAMNALYEQFVEGTRQPARKSDQGSLCREAKIQQLMEKVIFESLGEVFASQKRSAFDFFGTEIFEISIY